jgi:uncharacterized protein (TIGR03437 family)
LSGVGFSDETFTTESYPLPTSLGGVSMSVNGVNAPLYSVTPTQIVFQTPWSTDTVATVEVHASFTSPFDPELQFSTSAASGHGAFLPLATLSGTSGCCEVMAVHQNWGGFVTSDAPAQTGEVLHVYGTGFGGVDQTQSDGVPAPANPPARTVAPITCWTLGTDTVTRLDIPVLFAGLAPGIVGYYQLDIQLPISNLNAQTQLNCASAGDSTGFFGWIAVAVR